MVEIIFCLTFEAIIKCHKENILSKILLERETKIKLVHRLSKFEGKEAFRGEFQPF